MHSLLLIYCKENVLSMLYLSVEGSYMGATVLLSYRMYKYMTFYMLHLA